MSSIWKKSSSRVTSAYNFIDLIKLQISDEKSQTGILLFLMNNRISMEKQVILTQMTSLPTWPASWTLTSAYDFVDLIELQISDEKKNFF
jgi:hypothetical protein